MTNDTNEQKKRQIASHWSQVTTQSQQSPNLRLRWWQSPHIIKRINQKVAGLPLDGFSQGITHRAKEIGGSRCPFTRGISVGCGNGQKEMTLVREGLVSSFQLYELSEVRIEQGKRLAKRFEVEDKVKFILADAFEEVQQTECFDFVHWNNSLHHMLDVESAIAWSYRILKPGGMFYMDDYVGPNRMQWSDKMLQIASEARSILPEKYLKNPRNPSQLVPTTLQKPNVERLIQSDPSEAADSERIIECVLKHFPDSEITLTGGVVYHLALSDILHNFDESQDQHLLDLLMMIDDLSTEIGETHYGVALALK